VHEIISLYKQLSSPYVANNLYGASMKVDCPVGDLGKFMAFVSTGKCSTKVIYNEEYEKFEGENFTMLVFSIFNTRRFA